VSFDGLTVLDQLSLSLEAGELRFIIGPNGAGKTTLLDVITGRTRPASGSVEFEGRQLIGHQEHEIARMGIGRKFQTPTIFPSLTVWQNMEVVVGAKTGLFAALRAMPTEQSDQIAETLELSGLLPRSTVRAGILSHGEKQWLEIAMLLAQDPKLLLLDEPVAGMSRGERERTAELFRRVLVAHPDRTLLIVEHDMAFVRQLANVVTVLHLGSVLSEGSLEDVQADPRVIDAYLGHNQRKAA
ncbi:MAG: urea ABC transporter ATP-binding protein UrtD, partial [Chloroflexota bacterium]